MHKPWKGGIGSFVLINLLTIYLQTQAKKKIKSTSEYGLHGLAIGFLEFIGREFSHKNVGLSILGGGFAFDRNDELLAVGPPSSTPMIMSPLMPTDDIGVSIRCFSQIIKPLFH